MVGLLVGFAALAGSGFALGLHSLAVF
jgi:hypothetical protein